MTTTPVGFAAERRRHDRHPLPGGTYYQHIYALAPFTAPSLLHLDDVAGQDDIPRQLPKLEVRSTEARGLGLFAVDAIPAFSCILEDHALLSLAAGEDLPQLWPKYLALTTEDKWAFDALGAPEQQRAKEVGLISKLVQRGYSKNQAGKMAGVSSRFLGNSFKNDDRRSRWQYSLFPTVARVNHSCTPNAHGHYRNTTGAQYLFALRNIQPGEEIEICYFDITATLTERKDRMKAWSFECRCQACTGAMDHEYDRKLAAVHEWNHVDAGLQRRSSPATSERIDRAISIAKDDVYPWLQADLPNLYQNFANALMGQKAPKQKILQALKDADSWQERLLGPGAPQIYENRQNKRYKMKQDIYGA